MIARVTNIYLNHENRLALHWVAFLASFGQFSDRNRMLITKRRACVPAFGVVHGIEGWQKAEASSNLRMLGLALHR
jgi:hypothetical protein